MRSMPRKITRAVAETACDLGLDVAETIKPPAEQPPTGRAGLWWIQAGFATRLVVEYSFTHAGAQFTLSGPAVDETVACERPVTSWAHAEEFDDAWCYRHGIDYADPDSFAVFFRLLGELLGPWQTTASITAELGRVRAALEGDDDGTPAAEVYAAMAALSRSQPDRERAARHLDDALSRMPEGMQGRRRIAELADVLVVTPRELL